VLEIVERLCTHVAIINKGHIVANGSLDELRSGVQARLGEQHDPSQRLTLEEIFLNIVGKDSSEPTHEGELPWLS
jgi:ABC-2 type transport system ATP-binding protein